MLKPTLSHDNETIDHKYVDDKGNVHVTRLVGWPASIFNSLDKGYMSEFATRTLTVSPTISQNKIENSKAISNPKAAYPFFRKKELYDQRLIQEYVRQLRNVCKQEKLTPLVPFPNLDKNFRSCAVRDMRDFNHFLELVPAFTLLNLFQRPILTIEGDNFVVSTFQDVINAKALYDGISLTTQTGTEKKVIDFYYDFVRDAVGGVTVRGLTECYNKKNRKENRLSSKSVERCLKKLVNLEWVDVMEGLQANPREFTYFPLHGVNVDVNQMQLSFEEKSGGGREKTLLDKQGLSVDLAVFCQKDFGLWFDSVRHVGSCLRWRILCFDGSCVELSEAEFREKICYVPSFDGCLLDFKPKKNSVVENKFDLVDNSGLSIDVLQCPVPLKETKTVDINSVEECSFVVTLITPPGEPCLFCETLSVEYIIEILSEGQLVEVERVCEDCFRKRKTKFSEAQWRFKRSSL